MQTYESIQVHYDYRSRSALVVYGDKSKVLKNLTSPEQAEAKAISLARMEWGYSPELVQRNASPRRTDRLG
jgi:hypothetical protein